MLAGIAVEGRRVVGEEMREERGEEVFGGFVGGIFVFERGGRGALRCWGLVVSWEGAEARV